MPAAAKLTAAERKAIAKKASLAARAALRKAAGKRQRPGTKKNGSRTWPTLNFRDTPYSIWKAGKGDRFSVAAKGFAHPVIGYVYSNGDGTWSIERKGEKLAGTYNSIDQAATALLALASKRPVAAKTQRQRRGRKK